MRQSGVKCLACMAAVLAVAGAITWASQPTSKPVAPGAGKNLLPEGISSAADVYVIPIRGEINATLYDVLKYKVIKCRAAGAKLILFDMNTPGGEVMSALNITQMIKSDLARVRTICYVRPNAISAGAMIAVACNRLVMSETGILGDCAPISPGGKIEGVEREKIETVIRTEFRQSAQKNGYNEALAQSMVSADLEVWKLRHKTTGEIRYALATDEQGKVSIPPGLAKGDSKPDSAWEVVTVVVPAGKLLTMNAAEAAELGFAAAVLPAGSDKPMAEFMTFLGLAGEPVVMGDDIATGLALFLTHPVVTGLLVMG
ncbi:MAG: ATP-dependent Clp protease proteolytic subunit, partial [Planctomycetota bacterium]